jgi:Spy/CpxP family protein refolding chaperone
LNQETTMNTKTAPITFALAIAFAATSFCPAFAGAAGLETQKPAPTPAERPHARAHPRGELRTFLKKLDATEAQRQLALEEARAARPIAREARIEGARIRAEAMRAHPGDRAAARADARAKIRELRERTLDSLRPHAQKVLGSLSPDQRKTIEDAARARWKEPSEDRIEKVVSWLLTRPGAVARIRKDSQR